MTKKVADLLQVEKDSWFQENLVNRAPTLIAIFANLTVIIAEIRVFDVMYILTGAWWKALAASMACAVPFFLWELSWQYNHTSDNWRTVSLLMAGLAFMTSIVLGVADYVGLAGVEWGNFLLGGVVALGGVHTVIGFLYYYNDPDVARRRRKAQALGAMADQELNVQVTEQLLEKGQGLLQLISAIENQYTPEEFEGIMNILTGKKGKKKDEPSEPKSRPLNHARSFAQQEKNYPVDPTRQQ